MHQKNISYDDEISDEENPLIHVTYDQQRKSAKSNMKHKILMVFIVFLVLLSIHVLIFNNVKMYRREVPGWPLKVSRKTTDYILPNDNTTILEPLNFCQEEPMFLLIVVCSSPKNFVARQSIRTTWGNSTNFNYPMFKKFHNASSGSFLSINNKQWNKNWIYLENPSDNTSSQSLRFRVVFLLGLTTDDQQYQINNEHEIFGDILQENFIDSYNNLTLKTILMLKWVNNNCFNKVKYIMKCDDDSFVNVPNLIHVLLGGTVPVYKSTISFYDKLSVNAKNSRNRLQDNKYLLLGYKFCSAKPIFDVNSKWFTSAYMFNGEFYPDYLSGTAYVMSIHSAKKLYEGSFSEQIFHLEDVYLTGFVADKIKLNRQHHPLFYYLSTKDYCSLRGMITQHQLTPMTIEMAYSFITNFTIICAGIPENNFLSVKLKLAQRKRCQ